MPAKSTQFGKYLLGAPPSRYPSKSRSLCRRQVTLLLAYPQPWGPIRRTMDMNQNLLECLEQ